MAAGMIEAKTPEEIAKAQGFPLQPESAPTALPPPPAVDAHSMAFAFVRHLLGGVLPNLQGFAASPVAPAAPTMSLAPTPPTLGVNGALPAGYTPPPLPSLPNRLGMVPGPQPLPGPGGTRG